MLRCCLSLLTALFIPLASATAETVFVKYRGLVDLEGFACEDTAGSLVHRIYYQQKSQYLVVRLQDSYYHYCKVPESVVVQWLGADSKGRFFLSNIKGAFDCRWGGIPGDP